MQKWFFIFLLTCSVYAQEKFNVLIGSPIRQKPAILREFLGSLDSLDRVQYTTDYFFTEDNENEESRQLLEQFAKDKQCLIQKPQDASKENYLCNENTHIWTVDIVWKVAAFKDKMIEYAREKNYDYLFLIDSDIVMHPKTIDQLIDTKKDIISNIFWTCWTPETSLLPQVWMEDQYTQFEKKEGERLSDAEIRNRHVAFLTKMRTPGTYEVGGLGACTLISKNALQKDISFKKIKNLSFQGEDRHFCIRAVAYGLDLHVDTHYPSYHIYRESALSDVEDYKRSCALSQVKDPSRQRITLSMIMKNEADHYLRKILENAKQYITDAVIIDDASTDNSIALCEEILKDIPLVIVRNETSKFSNEIDLRIQQWKETVKTNPDWIVFLDADQMFEPKFSDEVHQMIAAPFIDAYYFRLYDLWDEDHYREDQYWQAHNIKRPFLVRYRPDIPYTWEKRTAQHCGSFPSTVVKLIGSPSELRLKHYGWATPEDRKFKYERYQRLDPDAKYGIKQQYDSILDEKPHLVSWVE